MVPTVVLGGPAGIAIVVGKRLGGDGGARPLQPVRGGAGRPLGGSVPGSRRLRPTRGGAILPAAPGGTGAQRWGTRRLAGHAPALQLIGKKSWRKSFPIFPRRNSRRTTKRNSSACGGRSGSTTKCIRAWWAYACPDTTRLLPSFPAGRHRRPHPRRTLPHLLQSPNRNQVSTGIFRH